MSAAPPTLVALDIDGTIVDHDDALSNRVREAVSALDRRPGTHVVIATGRSLHDTLPVLDRLSITSGWAVCSNGAVTLRLDPALERGYEIADFVRFDPAPALRLLREELPTARYAVEDLDGHLRLTAPFPEGELYGEQEIVPFDVLLGVAATRVIVRSPDHTPEQFLELVQRLGLHGVNYAVGWTAWLDLAPDGVSKASALEVVRERLGVHREATMAVGDGRNDVEMLTWAARGVAMGQGVDEAKAAADEVTGSVGDDGLAQVLEPLLG